MNQELSAAIQAEAKRIGADPMDFATVISYETGGTFDPWKKGPVTQWGEHRGLIQMGKPQREKYGYRQDMPIVEAVKASADYLVDNGFKPGMGLLDMYSTINAGAPGRYNASDANNGGAPGTVRDKVTQQMDSHRRNAASLLGGTYTPITVSSDPEGLFDADLSYRGGSTSTPNETPVFSPVATESPGIFQTVGDAFMSEQSAVWAYKQMFGPGFDFDENYRVTDEQLKADFVDKGIDLSIYVDQLSAVGGADQYEHVKGLILEDQERRKRLGQAGLTGTALTMANQMLDIGTLPVDLAIGAVAPELLLAKKAPRLHRALTGALTAGVSGAATEAMATTVNPHRDGSDVLMGAVFGLGFGGLAGALFKNPHTLSEAAQVEDLGRRLAQESEGGVGAGSAGAAALGMEPNRSFLDDNALSLIQNGEVADTVASNVRFSLGGKLHGSKNPLTRLAAYLVQDGVGKKGENVNGIAVTEEVSRLTGEMMGSYHRTFNPALDDYLKRNKFGIFNRDEGVTQFNEEVTNFIRDRDFGRTDRYDPAVVRMGKKINEINEELRKMANNPFIREGLSGRAVAGFDKIASDPHYIMRVWDAKKIADARTKYGSAVIEDLIAGSMRSANPAVPEEVLRRAAKGFSKAIENRAFGIEELMMKNIGVENVDDLVETLVMHGGLSKEDASDLIQRITTKADDAGRDGVAKRRTLLEENFSLRNFRTKDGVVVERFGISDLTNNDASHLTAAYIRKMSGLIGLARFRIKDPKTGEIIVNGITKDSEFDAFMRSINKRGADLVASGAQKEHQRNYDMEGLRFAYDTIKGRPTSNGGLVDDLSRTFRAYNYSRVMNQVGFAQLPEFGNVIGNLGAKAAFSQMPALRRVLSETGESIRRDGLAEDLELFAPVGVENLTHQSSVRFDEFSGSPNSLTRGTALQKTEGVLRKANRVTTVASGMAHVNEMLQTMVQKGIVQKFANMAHSSKGFSKKRLADMGLSEEMGQRIYKQFRKDGAFEYERGLLTGKRVVRAHFNQWDDLEAREAFRNAVYRFSNSVVQKNDLGNIPMWMNTTVGKTMMQFRTFVVSAYEKQTLRSIHLRDMGALMSGLLSMVFAGMGYVVQEKLRSIGRTDADEHLDDRLSWDNIGKAAFARAGIASIAPMIMDTTISGAVFGKPQFDFRTTEQGQDAILGNPTTGLIFSDGPAALSALTRPFIEGREMSQQEAKAIARTQMFNNFLPIAAGLNFMIGDLPERKPRSTD